MNISPIQTPRIGQERLDERFAQLEMILVGFPDQHTKCKKGVEEEWRELVWFLLEGTLMRQPATQDNR